MIQALIEIPSKRQVLKAGRQGQVIYSVVEQLAEGQVSKANGQINMIQALIKLIGKSQALQTAW